ncbi:outer membrane protein assembly factor BamD [Microbaculum marinum]|uniref:Outer membrane protein assembly factor BamD n=1 Tax=Microbaculum marinum TaxID=1764581 RepID=A0AAW9RE03_9HYPH
MRLSNGTTVEAGTSVGGKALRLAVLVAVGLSITACNSLFSKNEDEYAVIEEEPAEVLYNEGLILVNSGAMREAAEKFDEVERIHPYSEWARKSLIMSAYTNYESERYSDAITSARRYVTLYPGSEDAAYAQFLIAESYYNQIADVGRDQARSEKAAVAYRELIEKYPESEYAVEARGKLELARDQLAGKEMQIGRYYLNKHQYLAAINRFKTVVSDYQTTRHIEEALHRLTEAYYSLGLVSEAQTSAAILGHNYPDSPWYKDSYALLSSGGYEPEVNEGSWLSKLFRTSTGSL